SGAGSEYGGPFVANLIVGQCEFCQPVEEWGIRKGSHTRGRQSSPMNAETAQPRETPARQEMSEPLIAHLIERQAQRFQAREVPASNFPHTPRPHRKGPEAEILQGRGVRESHRARVTQERPVLEASVSCVRKCQLH